MRELGIKDEVTWTHTSHRGKTITMKQKQGVVVNISQDKQKLFIKPSKGNTVTVHRNKCQLVGSGPSQLTEFVETVFRANRKPLPASDADTEGAN